MLIVKCPQLKLHHLLAHGLSKLGRRKDCDIVLPSDKVSKIHLEFMVDDHTVRVRDTRSHNGTQLNNHEMVEERWYDIHAGDRIFICDFELQIVADTPFRHASDSSGITDSDYFPKIEQSQSLSISTLVQSNAEDDRQLLALVQLAQGLRDVLKTGELMQKSSTLLLDVFRNVNRVAIALLEDDQIKLKWWCQRQIGKPNLTFDRNREPDMELQISQTLLKHVVQSCEAILTSDAQAEFDTESVYFLQLGSVMAAPLMDTDGAALGVVYMDSTERNCFSRRDFDVFAAASTQLSLALNFARLHEKSLRDTLIRRDVENATSIQLQYLPNSLPSIPGFDVASFYRPARHIGGDYYDFVPLPNDCWAVLLGDVAGKGVPAALTMVRVATEARATLELTHNPASILTRLNKRLDGCYVTLLVVIVDPNSGEIRLSNAGHELPVLRHPDGRVSMIGEDCTACPLGVVEGECYEELRILLSPGDSLTLYSDGLPDAESAQLDRFGRQRLLDLISQSSGSCRDAIDSIVETVESFSRKHPQFDDMCLVQIQRS